MREHEKGIIARMDAIEDEARALRLELGSRASNSSLESLLKLKMDRKACEALLADMSSACEALSEQVKGIGGELEQVSLRVHDVQAAQGTVYNAARSTSRPSTPAAAVETPGDADESTAVASSGSRGGASCANGTRHRTLAACAHAGAPGDGISILPTANVRAATFAPAAGGAPTLRPHSAAARSSQPPSVPSIPEPSEGSNYRRDVELVTGGVGCAPPGTPTELPTAPNSNQSGGAEAVAAPHHSRPRSARAALMGPPQPSSPLPHTAHRPASARRQGGGMSMATASANRSRATSGHGNGLMARALGGDCGGHAVLGCNGTTLCNGGSSSFSQTRFKPSRVLSASAAAGSGAVAAAQQQQQQQPFGQQAYRRLAAGTAAPRLAHDHGFLATYAEPHRIDEYLQIGSACCYCGASTHQGASISHRVAQELARAGKEAKAAGLEDLDVHDASTAARAAA
jgi:hypothetical protein